MIKSDDNKLQQKISKTLRKIIKEKELSMYTIASAINVAGYKVTHPTIGRWMREPLNMSHFESRLLAGVLEIPQGEMDEIMSGK